MSLSSCSFVKWTLTRARRYPHGPARNQNSVQRGSVQYLSSYPGDPTTPGYPAYENSTRTEGENIPHIPSLPLSWANARILLNEISEGGLNRTVSFVNHGKFITRPPTKSRSYVFSGYQGHSYLEHYGCHPGTY